MLTLTTNIANVLLHRLLGLIQRQRLCVVCRRLVKHCPTGFNFFKINWRLTRKYHSRLLGCGLDSLVNWLHCQYGLQLFRLCIIPRLKKVKQQYKTVKTKELP